MPNANITVKDALEQLEALGDEKVRAYNTKWHFMVSRQG